MLIAPNVATRSARLARSAITIYNASNMVQQTTRPVTKVVQGQHVMEGAGVRICRTLGTRNLRNLDPFLMLDELRLPASQASAGFPDHPHRGMETCSIMISGKMEHRDSCGNHGVIGPGGVQWMTAGRGIVHSEMPVIADGDLWGFQLWINLPKKNKMDKPRYQDYQAEQIKTVQEDGLAVRVMAGRYKGVEGPVFMRNPGILLDVQLKPGASFNHQIDPTFNGFAYICHGEGTIGSTHGKREQALVFGKGDSIEASTDNPEGLRFLLVAGKPIGESVVQHGPFVMNTEDEIYQAFADFQSGKLQKPDDNVWE